MIPRKQAFSCTKGFQAQADVGINSPTQSNNQSVNVVISPLTKDLQSKLSMDANRNFEIIADKSNYEHKELPQNEVKEIKTSQALTDSVDNKIINERTIDTAKKSLDEMEALLKDKDNLIEALSLLLDIYENNPFIINKFIVAQEDELTRLLFLLTGADEIQLIKSDPEVKCCIKKIDKVQYISKIMVKKGDNTYNFKYSFPNVVQLLDNRKVTWKLVC